MLSEFDKRTKDIYIEQHQNYLIDRDLFYCFRIVILSVVNFYNLWCNSKLKKISFIHKLLIIIFMSDIAYFMSGVT